MAKAVTQEINLVSLVERFHSEDSCRSYLETLRWPYGVICPRCFHPSVTAIKDRGQYSCNKCAYHFSVTSTTIMHDTHLPLWKWFLATYTMSESKKGVSANQLKRMLGVSYKTAWYLCHRIRAAMAEVNAAKLMGTVEVDETYVGGKVEGMGHGYTGNKAVVVGAVQRDGDIRLQVIDDRTRRSLHQFIRDHVDDRAERIFTDEWAAYRGIGDADTIHETVNHAQGEYVRGDVYTNSVENVWSLLKRSIVGSFHHVSEKHLDAYLDELEWRFNNRENKYLFRDTIVKLLKSGNLEYKELTA
ncbi:MAG: IS1595 family transposase [Dehalococcoidia bacterium]|nr:IS1595 family transposase [Dehalococcoidia bacterium]